MIQICRQDIVWGYISLFFSIASGAIVLPMVLIKLSAAEVGMNYVMLSIGGLVSLVDFGFTPQFGRNVTYIYSGAQQLLKNGVEIIENQKEAKINYQLLSHLIQTARWIYSILSGVVLFLMLTIGTIYTYQITDGFNNVRYSFLIWVIYSFGTFFQIYYSYYDALLTGSGKIKESKKIKVYSNILKIVLTYIFLYFGYGLLGVVIVNFLYPFLSRYLSHRYYFTSNLKQQLSLYKTIVSEKLALFRILWYNSKKMGILTISSYLTHNASILLAGVYLSLEEVASYGLMIQLIALVSGISSIFFSIYQPRFAFLKISGNTDLLRKEVAYTMCIGYFVFIAGLVFIILVGPLAVRAIGTQTVLPPIIMILICAIFQLLDSNFWSLCLVVIAGNTLPFVKTCFYTALGITVGCYFSLSWLHLGLWGIVLSTGLAQCFWNNWYWPHVILKQFNVDGVSFLKEGVNEIKNRFSFIIK